MRAITSNMPHPNEGTLVLMNSINMFASNPSIANGGNVDGVLAKKSLDSLKSTLHNMRKVTPAPFAGEVAIYPPNPRLLLTSHPHVFQAAYPDAREGNPDAYPCDCPLNEFVLEQLRATLPARTTHNTIMVKHVNTMQLAPGNQLQEAMRMFSQMAAGFASQSAGSQDVIPGMTIFQQAANSFGAQSHGMRPSLGDQSQPPRDAHANEHGAPLVGAHAHGQQAPLPPPHAQGQSAPMVGTTPGTHGGVGMQEGQVDPSSQIAGAVPPAECPVEQGTKRNAPQSAEELIQSMLGVMQTSL